MSLIDDIRSSLSTAGYQGDEVVVTIHNAFTDRRVLYKWDFKNLKYYKAMIGRVEK